MSLEGFAALKLMQLFELRNDEVLQTGRTNLVHQKSVGRQGIQRLLKNCRCVYAGNQTRKLLKRHMASLFKFHDFRGLIPRVGLSLNQRFQALVRSAR